MLLLFVIAILFQAVLTDKFNYKVLHCVSPRSEAVCQFKPRADLTISHNKAGTNYVYKPVSGAFDKLESDGYYNIKLVPEDQKSEALQSFVPACHLKDSAYTDEIQLRMSSSIFHFDYAATESCLTDGAIVAPLNTTVKLLMPLEGSAPKLDYKRGETPGDFGAGGAGEKKEQTFWEKYWLYIIIFVVMFVVNGAAPPEQAQQQANAAKKNK